MGAGGRGGAHGRGGGRGRGGAGGGGGAEAEALRELLEIKSVDGFQVWGVNWRGGIPGVDYSCGV